MSTLSRKDRSMRDWIALKAQKCTLPYDRTIEWVNTCLCNGCEGQLGLCHKYYKFIMLKQSKKQWQMPIGITPKGQGMVQPL